MPSAALDSYEELVDAIGGWLQRSDLTATIPQFIRLTEARVNRLLRDPEQLVVADVAFTAGEGALPADFGEMIAFGAQGSRLSSVTPGEFGGYQGMAGPPHVYALYGGKVRILPSSASDTIPIVYYRSVPAISDASPTNWLLTRAPDVYLYGALLSAEMYGWNDERLGLIRTFYDTALTELVTDGERRRWGAAPLGPRVRRT